MSFVQDPNSGIWIPPSTSGEPGDFGDLAYVNYEDLLAQLSQDFQLDGTTGVLPGTVSTAVNNDIVNGKGPGVIGELALNSFHTGVPFSAQSPPVAQVWTSGGVAFNTGGLGGAYALKVPSAGAYRVNWAFRVDFNGAAGWMYTEAGIALNGTYNTGYGYGIASGYSSALNYTVIAIDVILNLSAGDTVSPVYSSSASLSGGTVTYQGADNNLANVFTLEYVGQQLVRVV